MVELAPMNSPTPIAPPSEIISICPAVIDRFNSGAFFAISNSLSLASVKIS